MRGQMSRKRLTTFTKFHGNCHAMPVQIIEWTEESAVNIYSRSIVSTH